VSSYWDRFMDLSEAEQEEVNFENMVFTFSSELRRIRDGERATTVIPQPNTRTGLRAKGLLIQVYSGGGKEIVISEKTRRILQRSET